jgi:hypothetical protein
MKHIFIFIFLIIILSCNNENEEKLERIESILPGTWNIESFYVPEYGTGLYYNGRTIRKDTILHDVGTITIPEFSIENLDLNSKIRDTIPIVLNIDNVNFKFQIEALFLSGSEYFAYFSPSQIFKSSETQKFLDSTRFFYMNAYIVIDDNNSIQIQRSEEKDKYKLFLSRI